MATLVEHHPLQQNEIHVKAGDEGDGLLGNSAQRALKGKTSSLNTEWKTILCDSLKMGVISHTFCFPIRIHASAFCKSGSYCDVSKGNPT